MPEAFAKGRGFKLGRPCKAIARTTGKQCRCLAMIGAPTCNRHGGYIHAYRSQVALWGPAKVFSLARGRSAIRQALRTIGMTEPMPPGFPEVQSSLERGLIIEAYRNRELAPIVFQDLVLKHKAKP